MITIEAQYPWGKRNLYYNSWEYIKDTGTSKIVSRATTQEEYNKIIEEFNSDKEKYKSDDRFTEYNSHYFELYKKNSKDSMRTKFYIIGFLSYRQDYDRAQ